MLSEQKAKELLSGVELWSTPYELHIVFGRSEREALEAVSGKCDRQSEVISLLLQAAGGPARLRLLFKILMMNRKLQAQLILL
jgi:hypothetical protein